MTMLKSLGAGEIFKQTLLMSLMLSIYMFLSEPKMKGSSTSLALISYFIRFFFMSPHWLKTRIHTLSDIMDEMCQWSGVKRWKGVAALAPPTCRSTAAAWATGCWWPDWCRWVFWTSSDDEAAADVVAWRQDMHWNTSAVFRQAGEAGRDSAGGSWAGRPLQRL